MRVAAIERNHRISRHFLTSLISRQRERATFATSGVRFIRTSDGDSASLAKLNPTTNIEVEYEITGRNDDGARSGFRS